MDVADADTDTSSAPWGENPNLPRGFDAAPVRTVSGARVQIAVPNAGAAMLSLGDAEAFARAILAAVADASAAMLAAASEVSP